MGHPMIGSDVHPERVEGAKRNVAWAQSELGADPKAEVFVHDATQPFSHPFDAIATETDLGMPHSQHIHADQLDQIMRDLDRLYVRFFQNLKNMGFEGPVVIAFPFFRDPRGRDTGMDRTVETIESLGFVREALLPEAIHAKDRFCLKYSRPDQAVGRAIYRFRLS